MSVNRRGLSNHKPSDPTHLFDSSMIRFYAPMNRVKFLEVLLSQLG